VRPIRLEIRGFTAFREPQTVDFEGLDLFAITGPTGSGKSSILDALTFVLYGRAERVGDGVRQLVSQGAPRAAVVLEFEADGGRYRVARSVTADAKTKVLVERSDATTESGWRQAGDGADRVREADATLEKLVGLDYAGFTRAVLLPQGRFAEFLAGDAKTRRKILADLLDLGLFERIAAKAGELARTLGGEVTARVGILEAEYAEATPEGLDAARREHADADGRAIRLAAARETVVGLVARSATLEREIDELGRLGAELSQSGEKARTISGTIGGLADAIGRAAEGHAAAEEAAQRGAQLAAAAAGTQADAELEWGDAATLAGRLERARSLVAGRATLAGRRLEAGELATAVEPAEAEARTSAAAAAEAAEREKATASTERSASETLEAARAADRIAAIVAGLAVGDPCPVCSRPLESLSDRHGAPELKAAEAALERARVAASEAAAACRAAERAATEAAGRLERERDRVAHAGTLLADEDRRLDEIEAELAAELGGRLPDDPVAELDRRATELRGLVAELETRRAAATAADEALRTIDRLLGEARAQLSTERARLDALPLEDFAARAVAVGLEAATTRSNGRSRSRRSSSGGATGGGAVAVAEAERPERLPDDDPPALATAALAIAERLDELAVRCSAAVAERTTIEGGLLDEARHAAGDLAPPAADLDELASVVEAANAAAIGATAVAARRVTDLEERIARRAELEAEIEALRERGARFKQLALELRQDRIVAFLQEEALSTLATAGSVHLEELSSGRYRLEVVDDEFLVVDTWNGEERRSVKTLSGGESFLASLGLALALSEQVPSLAASARSRVTSLFLDEGFGTLDEETLQVVIGAVEVLGGDDRIVGVVTHVAELAERLPARIVVEKSPRGSTIHRV
jgi:exonuclease SbcC